uniref:non-specific protein-tyrosine kinase n=1 Tax=Myripristis murdjan TaxID=586833 RepID=A0A667ZBC6_9TELE
MQCEEGTEWLLELLMEVQLQQYFLRIRDDLNVTRLSHFDYVKNEDLEKIGMGRPGERECTTLQYDSLCAYTSILCVQCVSSIKETKMETRILPIIYTDNIYLYLEQYLCICLYIYIYIYIYILYI